MINRLMEKKRQEEGFTLIEMLIVVIILGILAAVVVFGVSTFRDDSVLKACQTDAKQVETAATAMVAKDSKSPDTPAAGSAPAGMTPTYIKNYPTNNDYQIVYTKSGTTGFTVKANKATGDADAPWAAWDACKKA